MFVLLLLFRIQHTHHTTPFVWFFGFSMSVDYGQHIPIKAPTITHCRKAQNCIGLMKWGQCSFAQCINKKYQNFENQTLVQYLCWDCCEVYRKCKSCISAKSKYLLASTIRHTTAPVPIPIANDMVIEHSKHSNIISDTDMEIVIFDDMDMSNEAMIEELHEPLSNIIVDGVLKQYLHHLFEENPVVNCALLVRAYTAETRSLIPGYDEFTSTLTVPIKDKTVRLHDIQDRLMFIRELSIDRDNPNKTRLHSTLMMCVQCINIQFQ
jgi:hypothetical protein